MRRSIVYSIMFIILCSAAASKVMGQQTYTPDSQELYDTVVKLDSVLFAAYNRCDMEVQASMFSDSLEFYHDKGGLTTSKAELLDAIKKNICGKVTRILEPGSIEVYPIHGYGAVEIGMHRFNNMVEKLISRPGKFIIIWQKTAGGWKAKRVVSLH